MSIRRTIFAVLALATLLAAGCRSQRDAAGTTTANEGQPPTPAYTPKYYTSNFTCSAQGLQATGQLRMQPDSIIWLSASKIIELGRARFTPDSAVIYAKVMGRCFRGTYSDMQKRFGLSTSFAELQKMITADDGAAQLSAIANQFGVEATFTLEPWKEVEKLTFPLAIPSTINPL